MKFLIKLSIAFFCFISAIYAEGEPLNVGTENFSPPFIMQGANKSIFGFDIDMMNNLCKLLDRVCVFKVMRFEELIPALQSKKIDVAVSSITITAERSKVVNFSNPYALSYSRFLTRISGKTATAFSLDLLASKKIGVETGTIFSTQIQQMGIKNPSIKLFASTETLLEGIMSGSVDYILVDNPTATYWAANSANTLMTVGPAFNYGYGYGIAVQPGNNDLLNSINKALLTYENSPEYKQNFDRYLAEF